MKPKKISPKNNYQSKDDAFIAALNRAIEFHRTNQNDPYGIGTAVMAALVEVRDAYRYALNK